MASCTRSVRTLLDPLPIGKLRQLGGKFGDTIAQVRGRGPRITPAWLPVDKTSRHLNPASACNFWEVLRIPPLPARPCADSTLLPDAAAPQRLAGGEGAEGAEGGGRPPATVGDLASVPLQRLVAWFGDEAGPW